MTTPNEEETMTKKQFIKAIKYGEIDDTDEAWEQVYDLIYLQGIKDAEGCVGKEKIIDKPGHNPMYCAECGYDSNCPCVGWNEHRSQTLKGLELIKKNYGKN